jgi:high-affinity iron transporter
MGILTGLTVGYILYKGSYKLNLHLFFKVSCWIILLIAAGLAAGAAHEFEEYIYMINGSEQESTAVLWDVSSCCSQKTNGFFQILNALVGWRSVATVATVSVYFSYWLIVGMIAIVLHYQAREITTVDDSNEVQTMVQVEF